MRKSSLSRTKVEVLEKPFAPLEKASRSTTWYASPRTGISPVEPMKEFAGRHVLLIDENESVPFDRRMWNIARALKEMDAEVSVICPTHGTDTDKRVTVEGVEIYRYTNRFSNGSIIGYFREYITAWVMSFFLLHRILARKKVHVVHVSNPPDIFWSLALYLRIWRVRFIFDEHDLSPEAYLSRFNKDVVKVDMLYRIQRFFQRLSYRCADCIISTNESYRARAIESNTRNAAKTFVVRNGPDLRLFYPRPQNPALRLGRTYMAAFVGVMAFQDGVEYVVRAVDDLVHRQKFTDFVTYLIGCGDDWERLKSLAEQLQLSRYIIFTGRLSDEQALEILSTADICLSPDPSLPLNEVSTMIKVMEYMSLGKPIVSFNLKENRYSAGDAALYATNNDSRAFGEGMMTLFLNAAERERMGTYGRSRVDRVLSWQRQRDQLRDAYRYVLGL
jgi:glycosyltransferase involved in cell wall biosynthesis